ncbi:MAG TPA: hypothetical protein VFH78_13105 [Candidatus Thermoplasmatota archaeon]|nr:hypothetical protein [Candidatus Thermoplasmatota archaeon]
MRAALTLAALLLAAGLPLPAEAQADPACAPEPGRAVCRWTFTPQRPFPHEEWDLPTFPLTLATVNVVLLRSPDTGWEVRILRYGSDGTGGEQVTTISHAFHPARTTTALRHEDASTHVFAVAPGDRITLRIEPGWASGPLPMLNGDVPASGGSFEVTYIGQAVPAGEKPSRPAATAADPHLPDDRGEVAHQAWDIHAAWWDDAALGDGLMEAYVKVASLEGIPPEAFDPPAAEGVPVTRDALQWKLAWTVLDTRYFVAWNLPATGDVDALSCLLKREGETEEADVTLAHPLCAVDLQQGVLQATFPIASIGSPPDREPFVDPAARTRVLYAVGPAPATPDVVDQADMETYLFALGGPVVWSDINPRLDPPVQLWYEAPLAPANVADTLQVVGSVLASLTFLVGLALVWRRRRETARLLARVDAVAEEHADQRQALLALGRLEEEFSAMFRRHRISEAQYQVLSQRIATVATRYALRTTLGLDDGVPGDATAPATNVRVRRLDRP